MISHYNAYVEFEVPGSSNRADADQFIAMALNDIDPAADWHVQTDWMPMAKAATGETLNWNVKVTARLVNPPPPDAPPGP